MLHIRLLSVELDRSIKLRSNENIKIGIKLFPTNETECHNIHAKDLKRISHIWSFFNSTQYSHLHPENIESIEIYVQRNSLFSSEIIATAHISITPLPLNDVVNVSFELVKKTKRRTSFHNLNLNSNPIGLLKLQIHRNEDKSQPFEPIKKMNNVNRSFIHIKGNERIANENSPKKGNEIKLELADIPSLIHSINLVKVF